MKMPQRRQINKFSKLDLNELRGKNLASEHPLEEKCYVDVLLELANKE
jgi:hypothetical protein